MNLQTTLNFGVVFILTKISLMKLWMCIGYADVVLDVDANVVVDVNRMPI